jgi:hypothetical protein
VNTEEEEFDEERFEMTSSETPAPRPSTPQLKTVTINGRTSTVAATPQTVSSGNTPLYKKENRINLSEDKRNDLFDKATKTRSTKFKGHLELLVQDSSSIYLWSILRYKSNMWPIAIVGTMNIPTMNIFGKICN